MYDMQLKYCIKILQIFWTLIIDNTQISEQTRL